MEEQYIEIMTIEDVTLTATHYVNPSATPKGVLLYLHGGGFIFGNRDDLPFEYIQYLTQSGYAIVALDYFLAPEMKLPQILTILKDCIQWYEDIGYQKCNYPSAHYYLFGRSAGGYASLYLASRFTSDNLRGIISLYGYYEFNEAAFMLPSRDALTYPKVQSSTMNHLIESTPITYDMNNQRYLLYLYGRQSSRWLDFLFHHRDELRSYSLTIEELKQLPRIFMAHSTRDPDVPFRQSQTIHAHAPSSQLIKVNSPAHDFDRTDILTHGTNVYQQMVDWLDNE